MANGIGEAVKIDKELYWRIKASLKGIQTQQHNDSQITWKTQIDDILEKMDKLEVHIKGFGSS